MAKGKKGVVDLITEAYELYKESWRDVVTPFAALFAIGILVAVIGIAISLPIGFMCGASNTRGPQPVYCYFPQVSNFALGALEGLITPIIILAALFPIYALIRGKDIPEWTAQLSPQLFNAIKIIILRGLLTGIAFIPLAAIIAFNIAALTAMFLTISGPGGSPGLAWAAASGLILLLIAAIFITMLLVALLNFFLTFLEIEVALGGKGIFAAIGASFSLVKNNLVDVFVFNVVWWLLGIGVGALSFAMCCTIVLIPVTFILMPLIVTPITWISKVMLWQSVGGDKKKK